MEELVGDTPGYKNGGRQWQPKGKPEKAGTYDFPGPEHAQSDLVWGVYDVGTNEGWVSVGDDHDTAAFAVNAICRWWETIGVLRLVPARIPSNVVTGGGDAMSHMDAVGRDAIRGIVSYLAA